MMRPIRAARPGAAPCAGDEVTDGTGGGTRSRASARPDVAACPEEEDPT